MFSRREIATAFKRVGDDSAGRAGCSSWECKKRERGGIDHREGVPVNFHFCLPSPLLVSPRYGRGNGVSAIIGGNEDRG